MRTIKQTMSFKRDLKREAKGTHRQSLQTGFMTIVENLARDHPLPENYRDHGLTGDWKDHRDCHVKPGLILIYRKPDAETLQLVRLGSHAVLGLD